MLRLGGASYDAASGYRPEHIKTGRRWRAHALLRGTVSYVDSRMSEVCIQFCPSRARRRLIICPKIADRVISSFVNLSR